MPAPPPRATPALASLALVLATPADAAAAPVELRWDAPASCPADAFHTPLNRYLGARTATTALAVHIRLREQPRGGWRLHLDIAGASARQLTAASCETVADAAAFVVAQALADATALTPPPLPPATSPDPALIPTPPDPTVPEPTPAAPHSEPTPSEPNTTPPNSEPTPAPTEPTLEPTLEPPRDPTPPRTPPAIPSLRAALRLGGGLSGGALPSVGGELGLLLGLLGPRWRVDLLARGVLPTRTPAAASAPHIRARLGLWTLGARACAVPRRRALEFPLCAGAELGQVLARSEGLATDGRAALLWAAVTASPGLAWSPRPYLALVVSAQLAVALVRHDLVIRGLPAPFHSLGPVQAGLALALEFRLPTARRP